MRNVDPRNLSTAELHARRQKPQNALTIRLKGCDAVAYVGEVRGRLEVYLYSGRALRPLKYGVAGTHAQIAKAITNWQRTLAATAAARAARRAERAALVHTLKVGDVLIATWGYDQTNVDFFEVVRVLSRSVEVRGIACQSAETGWLRGECVPHRGAYTTDSMLRRVGHANTVRIDRCRYAYPVETSDVAGVKVDRVYAWSATH